MKLKSFVAALLLIAAALPSAYAAKNKTKFVPGKDLTLIGKVMPTPDRYARVDTVKYDGFTDYQRRSLNQESSGLALVFKTNSDRVEVNFDYKKRHHAYNGTDVASAGADLYIKRDGKWVYAGSGVPSAKGEPVALVSAMAPGEKECLLYMPLRSIIDEVYVGISPDATITPMENPFKHKIVFWGSSFTHGVSANRSGMAYPLQLQRATGLDIRSLGVSGNSKLQQSYARVLADSDADAFVFDAFSNPQAPEIRENFNDFVKTIRAKHPFTPIIFQQTIYRGSRNFNTDNDQKEAAKMAAAEEMVRKAMETDPNIYIVYPAADTDGSTCTDKTHPSDMGYYNWMESIRQPILDILAKYNMK
ncbi:SGNH/GDSL hydrolase family protein [Muribaculum intestinale]|uniref:SGNH/GDSL hydrolase family protein n=1 Tax=Muribaculum intestinale TaxID=1796646 RepID=UPI0025AA020A|nr:SGNH/GDSL hydrolase family protein [Muribaculum intestinale]